jgi:DNA-binding Lrp family transcriptional regulator
MKDSRFTDWKDQVVKKLNFTELKVWLDWYSDAPHFSAGASLIAKRIGLDRRNVKRALKGLEDKGFIKDTGTTRKNGRGSPSPIYQPNYEIFNSVSTETQIESVSPDKHKVCLPGPDSVSNRNNSVSGAPHVLSNVLIKNDDESFRKKTSQSIWENIKNELTIQAIKLKDNNSSDLNKFFDRLKGLSPMVNTEFVKWSRGLPVVTKTFPNATKEDLFSYYLKELVQSDLNNLKEFYKRINATGKDQSNDINHNFDFLLQDAKIGYDCLLTRDMILKVLHNRFNEKEESPKFIHIRKVYETKIETALSK